MPDTPLREVLSMLLEGADAVTVADGGRIVGSLSFDDIRRALTATEKMNFLERHPGEVAQMTLQHVELVAIALFAACAIALPLGIVAARSARAGPILLSTLNVIYTIPSLALLALLVPLFGIGTLTALIALTLYALMILVRNVAAGLRGVPLALTDAARGLGMSPRQTLWRVELPQALPVILGGVRLATITLIALATLASWINAGGSERSSFMACSTTIRHARSSGVRSPPSSRSARTSASGASSASSAANA